MKLNKLMAAAIFAVASTTAALAEKEMVISSWLPPSHIMNEIVWPEFINRIEKATDSRVTGKVEYQLASLPSQADLTVRFSPGTQSRFCV